MGDLLDPDPDPHGGWGSGSGSGVKKELMTGTQKEMRWKISSTGNCFYY
jgi:hypothetical protein